MRSSAPEEIVLMEAGVPLELGATLDEREQRELKVSAWDSAGTSRTDGGETERLIRLGDARWRW
jgi:hypothetical protein